MVQTIWTLIYMHDDKEDSSEFAVYKSYESRNEARAELPGFFRAALAEEGIDVDSIPGGMDACENGPDSYRYECERHYYECCIDENYLKLAYEED